MNATQVQAAPEAPEAYERLHFHECERCHHSWSCKADDWDGEGFQKLRAPDLCRRCRRTGRHHV